MESIGADAAFMAAAAGKAFVTLMAAPLNKNAALQRLLAKRSPWET